MYKLQFYTNWFLKEMYDFINKTGISPTHCIIKDDIYSNIIQESELVQRHLELLRIREDEHRNMCTEKYLCGIKVKKGKGKDLFMFYEEVE